jgi:hypothetical protein
MDKALLVILNAAKQGEFRLIEEVENENKILLSAGVWKAMDKGPD